MKILIAIAALTLVGCQKQDQPPVAKFVLTPATETCANVPMPSWPVEFDENHSQIQPEVRAVPGPEGLWNASEEQAFVPAQTPVYPDHCWEIGWVPHTKIKHAPDLPSVQEPVYRPGEEP